MKKLTILSILLLNVSLLTFATTPKMTEEYVEKLNDFTFDLVSNYLDEKNIFIPSTILEDPYSIEVLRLTNSFLKIEEKSISRNEMYNIKLEDFNKDSEFLYEKYSYEQNLYINFVGFVKQHIIFKLIKKYKRE